MSIWPFKKINFHFSTLLLILLSLICGFIRKTIYIIIIVLLHELGHIIICLLFNYKIIKIDIFPFGGLTKVDKFINDYIYRDLLLASGGLFIQIILLFLGLISIIKDPLFLELNQKILIFNLLPIIPLDGSKITLEIISLFTSYRNAIKIQIFISFIGIILFIILLLHDIIDYLFIVMLFLQKTIDIYQNQKVLVNKFIIERKLYHLPFSKNKTINIKPIDYQKDVKYYYYINGNLIDDYLYLNNYYF